MKNWTDCFYEILEADLKKRQKDDPAYSLRKYAKQCGVSPSSMSGFLSRTHTWQITRKRALKILVQAQVASDKLNQFASLTNQDLVQPPSSLPTPDYDILTDWTLLPILLASELSTPPSAEEIAEKLKLQFDDVVKAQKSLCERGYLTRSPEGALTRSDTNPLASSDNSQNNSIQIHHQNNLNFMIGALQTLPTESRDVTSITFSGNSKYLSLVKKEIRRFHEKVYSLMNLTDERDEVFTLVVGFAPRNLK